MNSYYEDECLIDNHSLFGDYCEAENQAVDLYTDNLPLQQK